MGSSAPPLPDASARTVRLELSLVAGALALLTAGSWWFLLGGAGMGETGAMAGMNTMAAPPFAALLLMWWLMMVAMMVPSAMPAILLYTRVRQQRDDGTVARTAIFVSGYLLAWFCFSIIAALIQHALAVPEMRLLDGRAAGFVAVAAGLYQLTWMKRACLRHCRSPAHFLSAHWRPHASGAVRLGLMHGAYCVGCCWLLMALLFVGGVMNLALVAVLTIAVAGEKLLPRSEWISRLIAAALIVWGVVLLGA